MAKRRPVSDWRNSLSPEGRYEVIEKEARLRELDEEIVDLDMALRSLDRKKGFF